MTVAGPGVLRAIGLTEADLASSSFDFVQANRSTPLLSIRSSQHLTTFMVPWGRFKFLLASMGLVSSVDEFNRRVDVAFAGVSNMIRVVDDLLRFDQTFAENVDGVA